MPAIFGTLLKVLGPIVAQMGFILMRERLVRKVAAITVRKLAEKCGPGASADILNAAADELEPPGQKALEKPAA